MSSWFSLCDKFGYDRGTRCLVITATDDKYAPGVVGMIKSFLKNSKLVPWFRVLVPDKHELSVKNLLSLQGLPKTTIVDLSLQTSNVQNHWCVWILEAFFQKDLHCFDYVLYVDSDICVFESLVPFLKEFDKYEKDNVCVMEHKKWHKKWRHLSDRAAQCFNAGFVIFKNEFFRSEMYESIKHAIKKQQPLNDEKFLRIFLSRDNQKVLHAPTKYNARIIWLHSGQGKRRYGAYVGDEGDEAVHVVHYVGQENKPWLRHPGRSNLTYWYDRWDECNDWEIE